MAASGHDELPYVKTNRPELCKNYAFPHNIHTGKLGEITVFCAVVSIKKRFEQNIKTSFQTFGNDKDELLYRIFDLETFSGLIYNICTGLISVRS